MNARHHIGAAEALRIFEGCVRNDFAGFQVQEAQNDGGGSHVHGQPMNRSAATIDFGSVQENTVTVAGDGGIKLHLLAAGRKLHGVAFNVHVTPSKRMASDHAAILDEAAAAGEAEVLPEMFFLRAFGRNKLHPPSDLHKTFLALSLLAAGCGDLDAERFSTVEK